MQQNDRTLADGCGLPLSVLIPSSWYSGQPMNLAERHFSAETHTVQVRWRALSGSSCLSTHMWMFGLSLPRHHREVALSAWCWWLNMVSHRPGTLHSDFWNQYAMVKVPSEE